MTRRGVVGALLAFIAAPFVRVRQDQAILATFEQLRPSEGNVTVAIWFTDREGIVGNVRMEIDEQALLAANTRHGSDAFVQRYTDPAFAAIAYKYADRKRGLC